VGCSDNVRHDNRTACFRDKSWRNVSRENRHSDHPTGNLCFSSSAMARIMEEDHGTVLLEGDSKIIKYYLSMRGSMTRIGSSIVCFNLLDLL